MHTEEEIYEDAQQVMGWADIIEGTTDGGYIAINDTYLAKVAYQDAGKEQVEGVTKIAIPSKGREYILLSEVERVNVVYTKKPHIKLRLKTGYEIELVVSGEEYVNGALQSILHHIEKAKAQ